MAKSSLFIILTIFIFSSSAFAQTQLFSEDWESGSIDASKWTAIEGTPGDVSVVDDGAGGKALRIQNQAGLNWGTILYGDQVFTRGSNLSMQFRVWNNGNPPYTNNGIAGGWHHSPSTGATGHALILGFWWPTFENWENNGQGGSGNQAPNAEFVPDFESAINKANSLIIKVTLGANQGGRIEWSADDGATFNSPSEWNTVGFGPSMAAGNQIGWWGVTGPVFIDDIFVFEGSAGPTPTPPPTPIPPMGEPLPFIEDWNSGVIDENRWNVIGQVDLVDLGGGDYAARTESAAWENYYSTNNFFNRQNNIRCSFRAWHGGNENSSAINGPWSSSRNQGTPFASEAIIGGWYGGAGGADFMRTMDRGWLSGDDMSLDWQSAWTLADSKANGVDVSVALGNQRGAKFEWKNSGKGAFILETDSRGDTAAFGGDPVYVKFGGFNEEVFIDNIVVDSDTNQAPPTPTGTIAPTPTSTPVITDISQFSQHFTDPNGDIWPWRFVPDSNILRANTSEHPGMVTLWERSQGQDIKGILQTPIQVSRFPRPWEFHMGIVHNMHAKKGVVDNQVNYAIGLNVALTFSNPSSWPTDRTQQPPNTRNLQLVVAHLGNYGENFREGLPQVKNSELNFGDPAPEVYVIYGDGDLLNGNSAKGNWNIPYTWTGYMNQQPGSWKKYGGPAEYVTRFRFALVNPQVIDIGVGFRDQEGWRMARVDLSSIGVVQGIWEIGPIVKLDNWITDTLPPALGITGPPAVEAPDPTFEYFVDYCLFYDASGPGLVGMSEEFDVPGFLGDYKYFVEGNGFVETHSNPGFLTVNLYGNTGSWAMCPIYGSAGFNFSSNPPPFEIETSFMATDDSVPWNFWFSMAVFKAGGGVAAWSPGIQNIPGEGLFYINSNPTDPTEVNLNPTINITFNPPLTQSFLSQKPLRILLQIMDTTHIRVGLKGRESDPWVFSEILDTTTRFGTMNSVAGLCPVSFQGIPGNRGWGVGNYPNYQKLLIDYLRYRFELTENPAPGQGRSIFQAR